MYNMVEPETITEEKYSFAQVMDDVGALCWLPESANEMLAATQDSLLICDTRQHWSLNSQIQ